MFWNLVNFLPLCAAIAVICGVLWLYPIQTAVGGVVIAAALDCVELGTEGINVGISIYPDDIACLLLMGACIVAILRWRKLPSRHILTAPLTRNG